MLFDIERASYSRAFVAQAYSESGLLINMQTSSKFHNALSKGKILKMTAGGSVFQFALFGVEDGLNRMESCSSGKKARAEKRAEFVMPPVAVAPERVMAKAGVIKPPCWLKAG